MSARGGGRRSSHHHEAEHENEERWLLTYADMITLLMTLFMVLFAISSVNTAKFEALKNSLAEAVTGKIVSGGPNIQESGATDQSQQPTPEPPIPAIKPMVDVTSSTSDSSSSSSSSGATSTSVSAAKREEEDFKQLKRKIDEYAKDHGLQSKLQTDVVRRGLVIRLLTDKVLFASGNAQLEPASTGLLTTIARLLVMEVRHPIIVEGHTDSRPIASSQFPTNWELSTSRAAQVVRFFIRHGVASPRLEAAGLAAQRPIASNSSELGRSRNRRVEIVLVRQNSDPST
ncbi:MAG TPA: flagellar motor protein MotB [Solirubrobacteraceae bacterium]|jgi:chemotaxis protein MotB|nr:flagellar motor protein MotB [Solirubrobacteraceae bacterium]